MDFSRITADFRRWGFVGRRQVFDAPDVDSIRARFDALEAEEGRERCQVGLVDRHFDLRFVWDTANFVHAGFERPTDHAWPLLSSYLVYVQVKD